MAEFNVRLVRTLIAVLDEGHFGRTADRLYVSPSALSQQIRKLERELGVVLIDRNAHPLMPTEAGELFLQEARVAVAAADRAIAAVTTHVQEATSVLRLGFINGAAGPYTAWILDALAATAPDAAVHLVQLGWQDQASAVRERDVHVSFVRPPVSDMHDLQLDVLYLEPRVVALPRSHHLAQMPDISIDDLDGEVQISVEKGVDEAWIRWWSCDPRPSGAPVVYGPLIHTADEMLMLAASGRAIAIAPEGLATNYQRPDVAFVPVRDIPPCPVSLCTRSDDDHPLVQSLRRMVREKADLSITKNFLNPSS